MSKIRTIKGRNFRSEMKLDSKEIMYPSLHLDLKNLPEARKWEVGSTYAVMLHVKQTSINEGEGRGSAGFDIVGIGVEKNALVSKKGKGRKSVRRHTDD